LLARLRDTVLNKRPAPDVRTWPLLALLRACCLLETVFDRSETEKAEWRIAQTVRVDSAPSTPLASVLRYVVGAPASAGD
jgi:hypothetical protein